MARKKVTWTDFAKEDFRGTLDFYNKRNKSKSYSKKLLKRIRSLIALLAKHPFLGSETEFESVRVIGANPFRIFYKAEKGCITILLIWDTRRNPENLQSIIKEQS